MIVLGVDPSKGRLGWCVARHGKVLDLGDAVPNGTWEWSRYRTLAHELHSIALKHASIYRTDLYRLAIERTPMHHGGVRGKGDPRIIVRAVSELVGALTVSMTPAGPSGLLTYPWVVEPNEWRSWYGIRSGRRGNLKAWACRTAASLAPEHRAKLMKHDDVAEAVLIAAGASMRPMEGPAGPSRQTASVMRTWDGG